MEQLKIPDHDAVKYNAKPGSCPDAVPIRKMMHWCSRSTAYKAGSRRRSITSERYSARDILKDGPVSLKILSKKIMTKIMQTGYDNLLLKLDAKTHSSNLALNVEVQQ